MPPNSLTREVLRGIIKTNRDMYLPYPDLIDVLYIPDGGWDSLSHITEFVNLKALYGNGNRTNLFIPRMPLLSLVFESLEGVEQCPKLTSLFLSHNRIYRMHIMALMHNIQVLDLSHNRLVKIEGISRLASLRSLNVSGNCITDIAPLSANGSLEILDVSANSISDATATLAVLGCMHQLSCLYIKDNPCCIERTRLIRHLPRLTYVNDLPVSEKERLRSSHTDENEAVNADASFFPNTSFPAS